MSPSALVRLPVLHALVALLCLLPARGAAAQEAVDVSTTFTAEGFVGTAEDFERFTLEVLDAEWDLATAAKVENLQFSSDVAEFTLDGWIFLKADVRGVVFEAMFFGDGRFRLTPPIPIERQQVARFTGEESFNHAFERGHFTFTGVVDQLRFSRLDRTEEATREARNQDESIAEWMEEVQDEQSRTRSSEGERQRQFDTYVLAYKLYERLLYPRREGYLEAEMTLDLGEERDESRVQLTELHFRNEPAAEEAVQVLGVFDHGSRDRTSLVTEFSRSALYDSELAWAATSAALEGREPAEYSIHSMELRLDVNPGAARDVSMHVIMDVEARRNGMKDLSFRITPLAEAKSVRVNGREVAFVQPELPETPWLHSPLIAFMLPRTINTGDRVEVTLETEGSILADIDGGFTWLVKAEDTWLPTPNVSGIGLLHAILDTTVVVPRRFTAISNGVPTPCRDEDQDPERVCVRFVTPHPVDFPFLNVGKRMKVDRAATPGGAQVHVYTNVEGKVEVEYYDENFRPQRRRYNLSKMGETVLAKAVAAITIYEEWFGEYPYGHFFVTPRPGTSGRGSAGMLLLSSDAFLSPTAEDELASLRRGGPRNARWNDFFVAHETAHQWWGNIAGIRSSRDQWFSEGFANYGAFIYLEAIDQAEGRDREWAMAELRSWRDYLIQDDGYVNTLTPLAIANRVVSAENRRGYDHFGVRQPYMYGKGGYVLHMLRTIARALKGDPTEGDRLFKSAVQAFLRENWLRAPSNYDMVQSFSRSYNMDLSWFFRQWVYGLGIPNVEFSYDVARTDAGHVLRGRIHQRDTEFIFPAAITLHYGRGRDAQTPYFYTWVQGQDQEFEVPVPAPPDDVTFNDDLGVLCLQQAVPWQEAAGQ